MSSVIKNFIVTFCVSLLIFGLLSYAIVSNISNAFAASDTDAGETDTNDTDDIPDTSDQPGADSSEDTETEENEPESDLRSFTVLLLGTDYQPDILNDYDVSEINKNKQGFPVKPREIYADAIMLLKIDSSKKEFVFSVLPSNMRVQADGNDVKLGSLYQSKGIFYMRDKVTAMTGMPIDYYAVVSVGGFADIIDQLGGIEYTVPTDMDYEDESQQLSIHLKKGSRTLSGTDAVNMLRYRLYTDGDTSRRALITAFAGSVFKKLTSPSYLAQAEGIFNSALQYVETDFALADLLVHLDLIFSYPDFTTTVLTYPGTGGTLSPDSYFEPDITSAIGLYKNYR